MIDSFVLSAGEMLALWKRRLGYDAPRTDCTVTRSGGPDLDDVLMEQARSWYTWTLRSAPASALPLTDIAEQTALAISPEGVASADLPPGCLRVVSVMMEGWMQPALVVTDSSLPEAVAQTNPFARAASVRPVAVVAGSRLMLFSAPSPGARLLSLEVVMMPDMADEFVLTDMMVASMPVIGNDKFIPHELS